MAPPRAWRCSSPLPSCGALRRWVIRRPPRRRAQARARCIAGRADADHDIAGLAHQADEPLALLALVRLDDAARGMAPLGELDRGIGERAAARGRLSRP